MKKGLLSILAASAVLVGCQNYDDQFDALNTQITQLKSTVDGLAGVQGEITALRDLVASVQGAVSDTNSALSSQLEDALADILALEDAIAAVDNSDQLSEVQEELGTVEQNVQTLLESDAFFNGDLTISSDATLLFAEQLGPKVKVINGELIIKSWTDMDESRVNSVTAQMITITEDVTVRMNSQSFDPILFPELSSAGNIKIAQGGSYEFPKLASAGTITLGENYSSRVTVVDFRALSTVEHINTGTIGDGPTYTVTSNEDDTVDFDEAERIHLTSIAFYEPKDLTIVAADNATVELNNFTSRDSDDTERSVDLSITGASKVELDNYKKGSFTASDVDTVILREFYGSVTIDGVTDLTLMKMAKNINFNGDTSSLASITLHGITEPDDTTDKNGPALDLTGQTNLERAYLSGLFTDLDFEDASNLISVEFNGTANSATFRNNGDLDSVDFEDAEINAVTVDNADDLSDLILAHSTALGKPNGQATALTAGSLVITGNAKLTELDVPNANSIKTLTIQGNAKLAEMSFGSLVSKGAAADKASVLIGGTGGATEENKLNAITITDEVDVSSADIGDIDAGDTGMDDLKTYLKNAATAPSTSVGVKVYFDSADLRVIEQSGSPDLEDNNLEISDSNDVGYLTVMNVTAATGNTVRQTQTNVGKIAVDALQDVVSFAGGTQGFTITYPTLGAIDFEVGDTDSNGDTVDNLSELVDYINMDGDKEDFNITMTINDSFKRNYYLISYTATGVDETVFSGGDLLFKFGGVTYTIALNTGDDKTDIATSVADEITGSDSFFAVTSGAYVEVAPAFSTTVTDVSPQPEWALPSSIQFLATNVSSTAQLSGLSTNAATDYQLQSQTPKTRYGYRITAVNNLKALNRTVTIAPSTGSSNFTSNTTLAGGTNTRAHEGFDAGDVNLFQYVAGYSDVADTTPGSTTNRHTWL